MNELSNWSLKLIENLLLDVWVLFERKAHLYLTTPKLEWSDCLHHPSVDAVYLSSNPAPSKNTAIFTLMPQGLQELGAPKSRKFENWA